MIWRPKVGLGFRVTLNPRWGSTLNEWSRHYNSACQSQPSLRHVVKCPGTAHGVKEMEQLYRSLMPKEVFPRLIADVSGDGAWPEQPWSIGKAVPEGPATGSPARPRSAGRPRPAALPSQSEGSPAQSHSAQTSCSAHLLSLQRPPTHVKDSQEDGKTYDAYAFRFTAMSNRQSAKSQLDGHRGCGPGERRWVGGGGGGGGGEPARGSRRRCA